MIWFDWHLSRFWILNRGFIAIFLDLIFASAMNWLTLIRFLSIAFLDILMRRWLHLNGSLIFRADRTTWFSDYPSIDGLSIVITMAFLFWCTHLFILIFWDSTTAFKASMAFFWLLISVAWSSMTPFSYRICCCMASIWFSLILLAAWRALILLALMRFLWCIWFDSHLSHDRHWLRWFLHASVYANVFDGSLWQTLGLL